MIVCYRVVSRVILYYRGYRVGVRGRDESKLQFGNGPVLVVLFCGGVTHAETRLAYALSKVCLSRGAVGRVNGEGWDGRLRLWRLRMWRLRM